MKYIFLIAAFNAIFFALLLLQKKPKALHDRILFYWLVYLGLFTATYAFTSQAFFLKNQLLTPGLISLFMLHGPFLYVYILALTSKKNRLRSNDFLHLLPFTGFIIYLLISSRFPDYSRNITLEHASNGIEQPKLFIFFLMLTAISGPVYFILSLGLMRRHNIKIFDNFSYSEHIDLNWLRKLVYIFGMIWTALIIVATIHHVFNLFSMSFCTDGLFLSLSFFIILIGYFGLKQKEIFIRYPHEGARYITTSKTRYAGSALKEEDAAQYVRRLKQVMATEKPYLNSNLTLPQLADMLQIPSHILSQVVNDKFGYNFFDFINNYRIEEVKAKMGNPEFNHLSLLGIALESGFGTKSAFNRVFKKLTGLTPSEYKKQL